MSRETHSSQVKAAEKTAQKTAREKLALDQRRKHQPDPAVDEELNEELEDSFPASDPPSMTQPDPRPGGPERGETGRQVSRK